MPWNERLLRVATSRWTERLYMAVIVGCCVTHTRTGYVVAGVVCALLCLTLLVAALPAMRELRRIGRDWPDTEEGRAYVRRAAQQPEEENKI